VLGHVDVSNDLGRGLCSGASGHNAITGMNELVAKALELAKAKHQVIGRSEDYYITLEQLNELVANQD
jgi:hypothetical protein